MSDSHLVVMITAPSKEVAAGIARRLLEKKLAACVNILPPIRSLYTWEGKVHDDEETLMLAKTRMELFESELVPAVKEMHPYDVPEIIALPIQMGSKDYLDWIDEVTK